MAIDRPLKETPTKSTKPSEGSDIHLYQQLRRVGTTLNGPEKVDLLMRKYNIDAAKARSTVMGSSGYEHDLGDNVNETEKNYKCPRCKDTGQLIGKGQFVKGIKLSCPKCGTGKVVKEDDSQQFDVESEDHWKDEKMIGYMKQKDVGHGHGTLRFQSNSGTTYTVELDKGKIISLTDSRGNVYELPEIQKYWDRGFPLVGAIAATIGDNDSTGPDEEEKGMLYPPEDLQEKQRDSVPCKRCGKPIKLSASTISSICLNCYTKDRIQSKDDGIQEADREPSKEKLPRTRCERCGKPVNPGISSRKCPSCHESDLSDAEKYYDVQESIGDDVETSADRDTGIQISTTAFSEDAPPGFPRTIYEKLVIKFKGDKRKINEVMWELHNKSKRSGASLDEKTPPNFPKSLHDKLLLQYKAEPEKAYAIMWKLHNEHGDKLESVVSEATEKVSSEKKCKQCSHEAMSGDRKVRMAEPGSDFCKPCKSARLKAPRTLPKK